MSRNESPWIRYPHQLTLDLVVTEPERLAIVEAVEVWDEKHIGVLVFIVSRVVPGTGCRKRLHIGFTPDLSQEAQDALAKALAPFGVTAALKLVHYRPEDLVAICSAREVFEYE